MTPETAHPQPLVTVLTPVYNGEAYLAECIESVLAQTYCNFEYIIVNNRSTDRSLEIAEGYANRDSRVRVHANTEFVDIISNHNIAFRLMAPNAKYCKVVSGDDFIHPDCLRKMVDLAEANPSVGIVGCYQLSGRDVRWQGFPYPQAIFTGKEVCRRIFLEGASTFGFGSPTSLMYRADVVRNSRAFYPNPSPHSDTSACFHVLQTCSFGFVYEILSYERRHEATQTSKSEAMDTYSSAYLEDLIQYGPTFLNKEELNGVLNGLLRRYHRFLAANYFLGGGDAEFWKYHRSRLSELGHPLKPFTLLKAAALTIWRELVNPQLAIQRVLRRIQRKRMNHRNRAEQRNTTATPALNQTR